MIRPLVLLAIALTGLQGCRHSAPARVELRPLPPAAPSMTPVRTSEQVRAYHLGRTVDPSRPDLMHEAHTIYRLEQQAHWDLRPWRDPAQSRRTDTPPDSGPLNSVSHP